VELEMRWQIVIAAAIMLTGCVTYGPTDLKLVALGKVNRATERQVPGFYEANGLYVRPNEPALKVVFSSRTDLLNYTKDTLTSSPMPISAMKRKDRPVSLDNLGMGWRGLTFIRVRWTYPDYMAI
jgi:hypothetical protein